MSAQNWLDSIGRFFVVPSLLEGDGKISVFPSSRPVSWSCRGGSGNSDSVISGSLASPKPPEGGEPEERGDEEHETESRGRPSRPRWPWPRSKATRRWPNWLNSFMSIPLRSPNGSSNCWRGPRMCLAAPSRRRTQPDLKTLHAKIGQLALENDFLEGALTKAGLLSAKR